MHQRHPGRSRRSSAQGRRCRSSRGPAAHQPCHRRPGHRMESGGESWGMLCRRSARGSWMK
eukprot:5864026-Prymnesium_polylepis.1